MVSGSNVKRIVQKKIEASLFASKIKCYWYLAKTNDQKTIQDIEKKVRQSKSELVVGIGGGRSVDIAKMIGFDIGKPFVSVPTSASHDGIASPFVSIKGEKPHSIVATAPLGVFVDVDIIKKAPKNYLQVVVVILWQKLLQYEIGSLVGIKLVNIMEDILLN